MVATGHTRTSGAVAGDGLPELSGSAPGLLPKQVRSARRVASQSRCLGCVAGLGVLGDELLAITGTTFYRSDRLPTSLVSSVSNKKANCRFNSTESVFGRMRNNRLHTSQLTVSPVGNQSRKQQVPHGHRH